jgi:thymidylate kinase
MDTMNNPELGTIYIEGTDCVGKDVVGEVIAGKYGITNIQKLTLCPDNPWNIDKTHVIASEHPLSPAYLLKSIIWDIEHYNSKQGGDQLQLSFTAARSAAWCRASNDSLKDVFVELLKFSPVFEHSFLLSASVEVKRERLIKRASEGGVSSSIDRLVFTNPDFVQKMEEVMKNVVSKEMGAQVVDTNNLSVKEVGKILIASIDEKSVSVFDNNRRITQMDITPELGRFQREIASYAKSIAKKYGLADFEVERIIQK